MPERSIRDELATLIQDEPAILVLVVEDSPTQASALQGFLHAAGFEVTLAADGLEGLGRLRSAPFDMVVSDVAMPKLDGYGLCEAIRAEPATRDLPVILVTALAAPEDIIRGLQCGADQYITKPYDPDVLVARVRALLLNKRLRRIRSGDPGIPLRFDGGEFVVMSEPARILDLLVGVFQDYLRKNWELERARKAAEHESELKSRALAAVAHELGTPLSTILGYVDLLVDGSFGPLEDRQRDCLERVIEAAEHQRSVLADILDYSRIAAGRLDLVREYVKIDDLARSVLECMMPLARQKGIVLETWVQADLPAVSADPTRIRQVLFNLVSNGVKFTPAGGAVRLEARLAGTALTIAVSDSGCGIRSEDLPRLFQEFERIAPPMGEKPKGTGLGLALTKRLVELHGGSITVESEVARGSTFTVHLPIAADGAE